MIRKICLALLLISSIGNVIAQEGKFTVSGDIKGLDSKEMTILLPGGKRAKIPVKDGTFSYTGETTTSDFISIVTGVERVVKQVNSYTFIPAKEGLLFFYAEPGSKIHFTGSITDFANAYPSGDATNNELASLNSKIYPLLHEGNSNSLKVSKKQVTDSVIIKSLNDRSRQLGNEVLVIKKKFLADKPASKVSAWLLEDMIVRMQVSNEETMSFFKKMDKKKLGNSPFYIAVSKRVEGITATATGTTVPDVSSSSTPDGKLFQLSSLRGKYVIVDFWGTWCVPCIAGMPKMKAYLEQHKDKLEILGIAQESDDGTKWKKAIEYRALNWYHVLDTKDQKYVKGFNVAGFPTKIIVNPEGKILARYVGEDDTIYEKLDELLK